MHVVATAGHVDHGKSTLVQALTGTDPDRFAEEKARGLTIDLGFAMTTLPSGVTLSLVDVPGHVRFIKNMLAGVGAVDACLFVVAATEGWKPQSEEHLRILELLGVRHGIIALTKVGPAEPDLIDLARMEIDEQVEGTFLVGAPVIGVDSPTGVGIEEIRSAIDEMLASTPTSADLDRPRLWVDRAFAARGAGTVVTGTLTGGRLRVGDELELNPGRRTVRVRTLQNHHAEHEELPPGTRCAINLVGVSHDQVDRGDVLTRPDQWHLTTVVDASLQVLDRLDHPVSRRGAHVAYLGAGEHPCRLRVLGPDVLEPGSNGSVRLFLPEVLPLLPGDRFVLRESGRSETVGGGEILDVDPRERASRARPDRSVDRVISERGWVPADELLRLTGTRREPNVAAWVVDPVALNETLGWLRGAIDGAGPLGLDLSTLDDHQRAAVDLLADVAVEGGRLVATGAIDPLADHPFPHLLAASPFAPPPPDGVDRAELREMVRRGLVVEQDGMFFATSAVDEAAALAARLLVDSPEGFTVSTFREAAGNTRRHAMPLLARLDGTGITRRRDDVRIAGPRLPHVDDSPA
ncbi:MAG: selenocysteine-specific translation elongation factor [Acidimicrobiales bacterium]|jgi:selenocysteine-specific elongation factor|nr:selenocysteine-specific translation elongation factor [Acidimicrobiales bacterium]MDP6280719.1 selenocysteine-specific translation elongation factor [Acidimicrobiales bacterium]MDP7117163.1 selenocysteine-specific translation elongation factor [Acidimicrobiales bacterium]MDP7410216.1 selenocysteine-specific translation elongation factor [Acidimicrobiales bacterium]MEE1521494.1 selenocysteine-specific translation elongation factor [Acidimicrobiales bacterium]|tara:strand:+ start:6358 stop:8091 length:1734 start_codon:yes stop_codon:yes gene_type:complete